MAEYRCSLRWKMLDEQEIAERCAKKGRKKCFFFQPIEEAK
ncbi:MAG: hypothetical protein WC921_00030 [Candidatus Paceibacterota bacterium]|jgi:hypothetical protein